MILSFLAAEFIDSYSDGCSMGSLAHAAAQSSGAANPLLSLLNVNRVGGDSESSSVNCVGGVRESATVTNRGPDAAERNDNWYWSRAWHPTPSRVESRRTENGAL